MVEARLKRNRFLCVMIPVMIVVLAACSGGKKGERSEENRLAKAYRLIDQGQSDEAIRILTEELQRPHDPETIEAFRSGLASAYVSKAGLSAYKFYGFARAWMQEQGGEEGDFSFFRSPVQDELAELKSQGKSPAAEKQSALEIFEQNGLETLAFFLSVKSRFEALPNLVESQEEDLSRAIGILESLESPSKGVALYRALLKTVRFKHHTRKGFFQDQATITPAKGSEALGDCWLGKLDFIASLDAAVGEAEGIMKDLAIAFPHQGSALGDVLSGTAQARANLRDMMEDIQRIAPEEAFQIGEVIRFARLQMGWDWVCD